MVHTHGHSICQTRWAHTLYACVSTIWAFHECVCGTKLHFYYFSHRLVVKRTVKLTHNTITKFPCGNWNLVQKLCEFTLGVVESEIESEVKGKRTMTIFWSQFFATPTSQPHYSKLIDPQIDWMDSVSCWLWLWKRVFIDFVAVVIVSFVPFVWLEIFSLSEIAVSHTLNVYSNLTRSLDLFASKFSCLFAPIFLVAFFLCVITCANNKIYPDKYNLHEFVLCASIKKIKGIGILCVIE